MADLARHGFIYRGDEQTYVVPVDGWYQLTVYGGNGGTALANGAAATGTPGIGGWSQGVVYLKKGTTLYIYCGGKGADGVVGQDSAGGYNGGGIGVWDKLDDEVCGGGGGATHIALVSGLLSTLQNQKDKVLIVAGGGGGAAASPDANGGDGGGERGSNGTPPSNHTSADYGKGGSQTSGYAFGRGQNATDYSVYNQEVAGGGGGWYGGTSGVPTSSEPYLGGAGGGSGYIGGVTSGCGITATTSVGDTTDPIRANHTNGVALVQLLMPDINKLYLSPDGTAKKPRNAVILGDGTAHHIKKLYLGDSKNRPKLVWASYD